MQCDPRHVYFKVSPTELGMTYSQIQMHTISALGLLSKKLRKCQQWAYEICFKSIWFYSGAKSRVYLLEGLLMKAHKGNATLGTRVM